MPEKKLRIVDYDRKVPLHKQRFASLNREWLERYFWVEDHDARAFDDPEGTVLDEGGVILMAELDGDILGTGSLFKLEDGVFEIAKMAVTENSQGSGIGEQLVLALIARAKGMGGRKIFIVSNTLLERAIRLYRRHGFIDSTQNRHSHYERGNITLEKQL
jgi:ribosomal protein S18 acetylase RimI-like enzyme